METECFLVQKCQNQLIYNHLLVGLMDHPIGNGLFPTRPYSFPAFLRLHAPRNQIGFLLEEGPSAFVFE